MIRLDLNLSTPAPERRWLCRRGVAPGEGAVREVAAFVLDHGHFSGVPPTALVSCQEMSRTQADSFGSEAKVGSLQVKSDQIRSNHCYLYLLVSHVLH